MGGLGKGRDGVGWDRRLLVWMGRHTARRDGTVGWDQLDGICWMGSVGWDQLDGISWMGSVGWDAFDGMRWIQYTTTLRLGLV